MDISHMHPVACALVPGKKVTGCDESMSSEMDDILGRDQRTTSHRVRDRCYGCDVTLTERCRAVLDLEFGMSKVRFSDARTVFGSDIRTCQVSVCEACRVTRRNHSHLRLGRSKFTSAFTTWLRLVSLFVSLFVIVQGAPAMSLENKRSNSPPKWINPCGLVANDFEGDPDVAQLSDDQLLLHITTQAKTALMHAQSFRDDYIRKIFNTDFPDFHTAWGDNHYNWLPNITKHLGEQLDVAYLQKLEVRMLDAALVDAYEYMQIYAVGLEQVVRDQEYLRLEFWKQFKHAELQLRMVLCELQVALIERGVKLRPDVNRNVMPEEYKTMSESNTNRNLRDWLIFRDYMNGLEYVVQVFEHLLLRLES